MTTPLRIVIGSDRAGFLYKEALAADLRRSELVASLVDVGVRRHEKVAYPQVAFAAAQLIETGQADRGLLVCHTGLGMAIAANKVRGIRAVTAHDSTSVRHSVLWNDAQVLTFGQGVAELDLVRALASEWLTYRFDSSSSAARKIADIKFFEEGSAAASNRPEDAERS